MLNSFITALSKNQIKPTAEELADLLWLATQINSSASSKTTIAGSINSTISQQESIPQQEEEPLTAFDISSQSSKTKVGLFPYTGSENGSSTVRIPAATMLPGRLNLARALRPLMFWIESHTKDVLNEEATVQQIANTNKRTWLPVLEGVPERWFEVALVVEQSDSMVIWQPTINELRILLEHHGAFRDVRTWHMFSDAKTGKIQIDSGRCVRNNCLRKCNPKELIDHNGRRLILVISDCISPAWYTGKITQLLRLWGQYNPVVIIQMLPQRLWSGSALYETIPVKLQSHKLSTPNAKLNVNDSDLWFDYDKSTSIKVPIITLEPEILALWSRMIIGKTDAWIQGVIFNTKIEKDNESINQSDDLEKTANDISAMQRVQDFYAIASPMARKLAGYLAAAPLTLHTMRVVQQTMLPESRQVHLAEIFLGGLLKQISQKNEPLQYDFFEGVRDLLLDSVQVPKAMQVIKKVSEFVEYHFWQSRDFLAFVSESTVDEIIINDKNRPFAIITAKVLRRLGGKYRESAKKITERIEEPNVSPSKKPVLVPNTGYKPKQSAIIRKKKILILDVLPNWRDLLEEYLSEKYEVQTASNFEEAKNFMQQTSFDLIIVGLASLNVFHPEDSMGIDFLDFVEREYSNIPRIIIDNDPKKDDTLTKGKFNRDELIEAVEKNIHMKRMKKKILILDTLPNWRDIFKEYLSEKYDLQIISNIEEAKNFMQKASFDLVIVGLASLNALHPEDVELEFLDFLESEHPNIPRIIIDNDPNNDDTLTKGKFSQYELIKEVENYIKKLKQVPTTLPKTVDFLIITTLREGYDAVLSKFSNIRKIDSSQSIVKISIKKNEKVFTYCVVIVCLGFLKAKIGTVRAAIKTIVWLKDWQPKNVLLVGIAGGVRDKSELGDIIIPEKIIDASVGKVVKEEKIYDYDPYEPTDILFDKTILEYWYWSKHIKEKRPKPGESKIIRGLVISSGEVIADSKVVESYQKTWRKMRGFEMEGAAVAAAIKNVGQQTEFLMIRAVSDFGDENKESDKKWRPYAFDAAASYTRAFLESGPVPPIKKDK
jgi:nucleoside phosphorylase